MNFDLNALLVFHEVVNSQSISRAARVLGLPKSTVSRKIQHLESQVGASLLKRGNRRISITDEGLRLNDHCHRIAAELVHAGLQTAEMRTSLKGRLRVSMPNDFGVGWLGRAIASFVNIYPAIEIDIHVNGRWVDVSEETYDVAVHLGRPLNPELPLRRLSVLTRGVYASPAYVGRNADLGRLWAEGECVLTEQQLAEGIWTANDGREVQRRPGRVVVNNIGVARELVRAGIGVGILPNVLCRSDVRSGRLVRIAVEREIPPLEASATFFSGRYVSQKVKVFLDHLASFLASDEDDHPDGIDTKASSLVRGRITSPGVNLKPARRNLRRGASAKARSSP
jgi:DNA-binding transcriptional LysR family regulator